MNRKTRLWIGLLAAILFAAFLPLLTTHDGPAPVPPAPAPGQARGLLATGPNLLPGGYEKSFCATTGWTFGAHTGSAAFVDGTVTHDTCGSAQLPSAWTCPASGPDPLTATESGLLSSGDCPEYGGSFIDSPPIAVTAGQRYTLSYYVRSEAEPRGAAYAFIGATNASGTPVNSSGAVTDSQHQQILVTGNAINTKAGLWEEVPTFFTATQTGYVSIHVERFFANTYPISKMWIDDFYFSTDWVTREVTGSTTGFTGTYNSIDAAGNFTQKLTSGSTVDTFPIYVQPDNAKSDLSYYAHLGFNGLWAIPSTFFGSTISLGDGGAHDVYWNGSAFVHQDWSHSPTNQNPLARAERAVDSVYAPDGMRWMVDINSVIRGSVSAAALQYAIRNITAFGWDGRVSGWIHDAEQNFYRYNKMAAVLGLVATTDAEGNGGVRRHPIITNAGLGGSDHFYTDTAGVHLNNATGVYSGTRGPFEQLRDTKPGVPANYCQIQSGLGWGLKTAIYDCLGNGGKMIAIWADNGGCYAFASCPFDQVHAATWPGSGGVVDSQQGEPYEPMFYSGTAYAVGTGGSGGAHTNMTYSADFHYVVSEIQAAAPLLKTSLPSWTITSSNANVDVFPRTLGGEAYLIAVNRTLSPQTATFTVSGITPGASLTNYFTGATIASISGSSVTVTLPALGPTGSVGGGGGQMIAKLTGSGVAATTTTAAPTTTTTTTPPAPGSVIDDPAFAYPSGVTGAEGTSWAAYAPPGANDPRDYNSTNHSTCFPTATATISFTGVQATLYGATGPVEGIMNVSVDGGASVPIDTYSGTAPPGQFDNRQTPLYTTPLLASGAHTIGITVSASKNALSSSTCIVLDYAAVSVASATTTTTTTTPPPPASFAATPEHLYSSSLPTPPSTGAGAATTHGVRINVNCVGTIPGVWWFKVAGDTGSQQVGVWSGSTLLASSTTTATTGTGWRYAPFSRALAVAPGATLTVGVWTPTGAYGYDASGFVGRNIYSPSGCLTAPATGTLANGIHTVGASLALPTIADAGTEFFVSPAFVSKPVDGTLVWSDEFASIDFTNASTIRKWRQNDVWQNPEKGYVDFTGNHGSWNGNKWESIPVSLGGTDTLNAFSTSAGVLEIDNRVLPPYDKSGVLAAAAAQGQSPSQAPERWGGYMVTDNGYIDPATGVGQQFLGGYVEVKAKFPDFIDPAAKGLLPGIWLFAIGGNTNLENKGGAEIDIAEMFGWQAGNIVNRTLHFVDNFNAVTQAPTAVGSTTLDMTQWHTYGLDWRTASMAGGPRLDFYIDGTIVNTVTGSDAAYFNTPMSLRFSMSADADFIIGAGRQTNGSTANPARMLVDYARIYSSLPAGVGPTTTTTTTTSTTTTSTTSTTTTVVGATTTTVPTSTPAGSCVPAGRLAATPTASAGNASALGDGNSSTIWTAATPANAGLTFTQARQAHSLYIEWVRGRAARRFTVSTRSSATGAWTVRTVQASYSSTLTDQCWHVSLPVKAKEIRVQVQGAESSAAGQQVQIRELAAL